MFQCENDCDVGTVCIGRRHGYHLWLVLGILGTYSGPKWGICTMPIILLPPINFGFLGD